MTLAAICISMWPATLAGFFLWIGWDIYSDRKAIRKEIEDEQLDKDIEDLLGKK